jgi:lysophospholipase L1-like esterase
MRLPAPSLALRRLRRERALPEAPPRAQLSPSMSRLRASAFRLVALCLGALMALLVAEVGLRVSPWPGPPLHSGRLETRHRSPPSRPDFRDRGNPLLAEKPIGVRRVVVVGDSFTWGAGVLAQHAYPDVMGIELERRAQATRGASLDAAGEEATAPAAPTIERAGEPGDAATAIEIVNFSRPGWNTTLELGALRRAVDRLAPDAIVLGYCLNDAEPHRRRELARLREGLFPRQPESGLETFFHARSAVYRMAFQRADNLRMRRLTKLYYHRFYAAGQPTWEATRRALAGLRDLAAERRVPFLLVVFPIFDSQLDHRYRYRALHEEMARTATELAIDHVDLLPRYVGIDARRLALDPFLDAHPSELAHRIAAAAILEELERRGLLAGTVGEVGGTHGRPVEAPAAEGDGARRGGAG